jgi:NADPH:quinone reductase-like Zn-dependent oxidoreductase
MPMQAIVYRRYGPPEVLELAEIDKPVPAPGQVLVRIHAAAVNPYDWHFMRGAPKFFRFVIGLRGPKSPRLGGDLAGVVESVGDGVTLFKVGDAVFGLGKGSFAEYACAAESNLAIKPETLSFEQAAAVPIAGLTALQGLRDSGKVQPGQRLLINGAAGGVGTFSVQIGKWLGAHVTGVCSTRNMPLVKSLDADRVIDYTNADFTQSGDSWDVIFDLVGNQSLAALRRVLEPKGVLVACGGGGIEKSSIDFLKGMIETAATAPFVSQRFTSVLAKANTVDLNLLAELLEKATIRSVLDRSYPLSQVGEAIAYVETGHARGKVTIAIR